METWAKSSVPCGLWQGRLSEFRGETPPELTQSILNALAEEDILIEQGFTKQVLVLLMSKRDGEGISPN